MTIKDLLSMNEEIKEKIENNYLSLKGELNSHIYITKIGIKDKCKKLGYTIRLFDLDSGVCFCRLNICKSAVLTQLEFVSEEDEENKLKVYGIDTDNNACSDYANNVKMNTDEMFNFLMQLIKIEQELIKEMEEKL